MSQVQRKHGPAFKAKVALEGAGWGDGGPTGWPVPGPSQPDSGLEEGPDRGAASVFGNAQDQKARSEASLIAHLYQEIGQLKVDRDFLAERSGP